MLTDALASADGVEPIEEEIEQLEETLRMTSICGLGQVALGPVTSVLGLRRGATAARPHPRRS
jgi:formate dehydrogenase beta subunit